MNKENVFEQLKIDEGIKYESYFCSEGVPTFGVGHKILESDPECNMPIGTPVSKDRVWEVFEDDLEIAINECEIMFGKYTWHGFPDEVQEVCVNMMFNLGRPRLSKFRKLCKAVADRDWQECAVQMEDSRWHKQVTNRANRLISRMKAVDST